MPMPLPAYVEWEWWLRWFMVLNVTDEGVYAEEQVPDDYGGPILTLEQNIILFEVTGSGYMQRRVFTPGLEKVMDKTRLKGIGLDLQPFEDLLLYAAVDPVGPSIMYAPVYMQERPDLSIPDNYKLTFRELLRATTLSL